MWYYLDSHLESNIQVQQHGNICKIHGKYNRHVTGTFAKKYILFFWCELCQCSGKGTIPIQLLKAGDLVQTSYSSGAGFSRVLSLMHLGHESEVEYLQLSMEGSDLPLEITQNHY
jgi:hypothetical protein